MANLVLKNNSSTTSTGLTMEVNGKSTWKLINNAGTFVINSTNDLVTIDNTGKVNINKGHLYLNGAQGTSTSNTTQIIFKQGTTEHIALSSNDDAFIINPTSSSSANQIVLYLGADKTSLLPSSLNIKKNLTVDGYISTPRIHLTSTTDAEVAADNNVALITGNRAGTHLAIDNNEIISKKSGTTAGPLYLNTGNAGHVHIGTGGLSVGSTEYTGTTYTIMSYGPIRATDANISTYSSTAVERSVYVENSEGKASLVVGSGGRRGIYNTLPDNKSHWMIYYDPAKDRQLQTATYFTGNIYAVNSSYIPSMYFTSNSAADGKPLGAIRHLMQSTSTDANYTYSAMYFYNYSYVANSRNRKEDSNGNGIYERFKLPTTAAGLTESATYNILTTKNTVTVAQGGTGITSNPSMLVNLGSTSADTVFKASPRPGITGTLSIAHGGTGGTAQTAYRMCYTTSSGNITSGYHYVTDTKVGIRMTSAPDTTLGVSGTISATSTIQTGGNTHRAYLYFRPTATSGATGYIRIINGADGDSVISNSYFALIQNSYTANSNTVSSKYETFRLPSTSAGLTENKTYSILTSKETVTVAQGGTGKTTGNAAANYFMNALETGSSTPVDADYYISQYVGGGTTTTTYHRRPMSALWAYIKGKMAVSNNGPTLAWGTTSTVGTVAGTALKVTMPANPNTDAKVQQARSAATNWRPVLMHYTNGSFGTDPGAATNCVYYNESVAISPSGGHLQAAGHLIAGTYVSAGSYLKSTTYVNAGSYIKAGSYGFITSYLSCGALIIGKNGDAAGHTYTGYGTSKPKGNVTAVLGRVYFQLV